VSRVEPGRKRQKTGGRAKGTPNKATAALKDMILNALGQVGGEDYLIRQSEENPTAFMTLVGKVLPLQVNAEHSGEIGHRVIERRIVKAGD
jgi:hypothetical protein